ncbi:MAG: hypothetical protein ACKVU4_12155 [Phycisphaerales bacterium]
MLWRTNWTDVVEVATWKLGLFAVDSICIGLRTFSDPAGQYSWACECDQGFAQFRGAVVDRFPPEDKDWLRRVMRPPFETNFSVLWRSSVHPKKESEPLPK